MTSQKVENLRQAVFELYQNHEGKLLFHGWHHINFVTKKAVYFASFIDADVELV